MQDAIAAMILEELEDEIRWDATFAKSHNILAKLAGEAMAEYRADFIAILYHHRDKSLLKQFNCLTI